MKMALAAAAMAVVLLGFAAPADAARCTGDASCRACKNCSSCGHCKAGGSCGVCATSYPDPPAPELKLEPSAAERDAKR